MSALSALPAIPGAGCPPAAAALGAAGLGPVCQAASGVTGLAGSAASQLAGAGVDGVLNGLGDWVATGATWLLGQIGAVISSTTTVDLGASWFTAHYQTMAGLAAMVIVPLLLLGIMQAVYRQSASMLVRSVLVHVPLAVLLTAVAVKLVQLGLALTDAMSAAVAQGSGLDAGHFMGSVTDALAGAQAAGSPGAPAFVLFLGALTVVFGAVMVWIELLLRAAAVYVAVLFLPLAMASLAWPAIAHWCRRLVDTLVALILGKFVIVAVLSLAAGALAGGTGSSPSAPTATGSGSSGGFGAVLGGAALLLLAAFSPWALLRLLPFVESGAVGHLEGIGRRARQVATVPARGLAQVAMGPVANRVVEAAATSTGGRAGLAATVAGGRSEAADRMAGRRRGGAAAAPAGTAERQSSASAATGDGPDLGPSTAEVTGVGTTEPPGQSIPYWEPNLAATAWARYYMGEGERPDGVAPLTALDRVGAGRVYPGTAGDRTAGGARPTGGRPGPADLVQLPLATGARAPAYFGRDELGPRLIAHRPEPDVTPPADPDG